MRNTRSNEQLKTMRRNRDVRAKTNRVHTEQVSPTVLCLKAKTKKLKPNKIGLVITSKYKKGPSSAHNTLRPTPVPISPKDV